MTFGKFYSYCCVIFTTGCIGLASCIFIPSPFHLLTAIPASVAMLAAFEVFE